MDVAELLKEMFSQLPDDVVRPTDAELTAYLAETVDSYRICTGPQLVATPLAEPHGSMLAFLSDLHEQTDMQIGDCNDETLRAILINLRSRIEAAGVLVKLAASSSTAE